MDQGTNGEWVRPQQNFTSRGWAWNVFNITNTGSQTYKYDNLGHVKGAELCLNPYFFGCIEK